MEVEEEKNEEYVGRSMRKRGEEGRGRGGGGGVRGGADEEEGLLILPSRANDPQTLESIMIQ